MYFFKRFSVLHYTYIYICIYIYIYMNKIKSISWEIFGKLNKQENGCDKYITSYKSKIANKTFNILNQI